MVKTNMLHSLVRLWLLCWMMVFSGCYPKYTKTTQASWAGGLYTVQRGETVHSIALKKKISAFDLMEVNGIVDTSQLKVGQRLYIPEPDVILASPKIASKISKPTGKKINLSWPVKGGIVFKSFDLNPNRLHEGVAIAAPLGTPVMAAQDGEVIYVGDDGTRYGRIVIIKHEDPFVTIYAHLDEVNVTKGKPVKCQASLGTVGTSGGVDSPRVYFQVRYHRTPVDPELYLKH